MLTVSFVMPQTFTSVSQASLAASTTYQNQTVAYWTNGHPVNPDGFVMDGTPQLDDAHCVGNAYQQFTCLAARHPGLLDYLDSHYVSPIPRNKIEACIVSVENGGDWYNIHGGDGGQRYQIEYKTWVSNGGNPSDWGHASPMEQDRVFENIVAADGYGPWTNYDPC